MNFWPIRGTDRFDSLSWQRNLGCCWIRLVKKGTIAGDLLAFLVVKVGETIDEMGIVLNGIVNLTFNNFWLFSFSSSFYFCSSFFVTSKKGKCLVPQTEYVFN